MRYQFQSNFSRRGYLGPRLFTDAIKLLVSINLGIFLLQTISGQERVLFQLFGLVPRHTWTHFMIWQPVTYLFFHGHIWHVLINMFVLWMFGSELEMVWGKKEFLKYYFLTGVGSGIVTTLFHLDSTVPVVGASGAVYGILLAFALLFPNRYVFLYFLIPIKVKYLVIVLGAIAFFSSFNPGYSQVSHLTHLSGMVIGFFYLRSEFRLSMAKRFIDRQRHGLRGRAKTRKKQKHIELQQEVDRILDKINEVGYDALTREEQDFLYEASKKISRQENRD